MITAVKIEAFRGVREGGVEGLSPLSILVGPNNSGKSTLLEAIAIVGLGARADESLKILLRRGGPAADALRHVVGGDKAEFSLDWQGEDEQTIQWMTSLSVRDSAHPQDLQEVRNQELREPVSGIFQQAIARGEQTAARAYVDSSGVRSGSFSEHHERATRFSVRLVDVEAVRGRGALEDAYSRLELAGRVETVVGALRRAMPTLTDLKILKSGSDFILHTIHGKERPVPAYLAGDGFKRFLELASAALGVTGGVVLLEEPESYQHPRYLQELTSLLLGAAKSGTQVILSTHSIELIDLLLHSPQAEGLAYPTVHRMRLIDGKLRATTIDRASAIVARDELLEDLRS